MGIAENLARVRENVAGAARAAGRDPAAIKIVAITKEATVPAIREAAALGITDFGENRVQAARDKIAEVPGVRWHLVGHLQANKARHAVRLFKVIHSLDRPSLAEELQRRAQQAGRPIEVLVQVNVTGEATKHGLAPADLFPLLDAVGPLDHVRVRGLMTIGPLGGDSRPAFARLRELFEQVRARGFAGVDMEYLSMGMTDDYPVAVQEGANLLRIGRAIFQLRGGGVCAGA
ncbi:MAG: YggS family pyridoxal phosphate-dependent enzyme [bacterium]|nr:YggS family pyridoxal phosphate-dependent enzyme [bacterium]